MTAPKVCLYCDGRGNSTANADCGFCDKGRPLDTQADWDASWGRFAPEYAPVPVTDGAIRGLMFAIPMGVLLWAVIILALRAAF